MRYIPALLLLAGLWLPQLSLAKLVQEQFLLFGHEFTLHRPEKLSQKSYPLLVLYHGCTQTSQDIAELTQLQQLARQNKALVLTPNQSSYLNPSRCWNWFLSQNQERSTAGESAALIQAIEFLQQKYSLNKDQFFIAGFSAGAAQALNLLYCYPETFAGVAVHSGPAYKSATDVFAAEETLRNGSRLPARELGERAINCAKPKAEHLKYKQLLIFQGKADPRVAGKNALETASQFLAFFDFADDGAFNRSLTVRRKNIYHHSSVKFATEHRVAKILGFGELHLILIDNLEHKWSGGKSGPYAEPDSLAATDVIREQFFSHYR